MFRILVVDDDSGLRMAVKSALLATNRFEVEEAFDGVNALEKVKEKPYNMVILDVDMPRKNGLQALKEIKEHDPSIQVLILTAYGTIDMAVQAVKDGAYNYISKPIKGEVLVDIVDRAFNALNLISTAAASAPQMNSERAMVGQTASMQKIFGVIMRLSKVDTPVLIRGASGTGKELVARAIHHNSAFKDGKFVAINCSAIPENLFESELFGHEKGSFTGADQRKIGRFQYAEGGTLFLDEVGDLPLHMQVKLLRVLQEKVFTPVGSNREIQSHTRIIAATNRPLEDMIKKSMFRDDLYYRLNVMPIFLPALAERTTDIDHLVNVFIQKFNKEMHRKMLGVSEPALNALKKYDWPGNIRELENVIEHSFILEESNFLTVTSLPEYLLKAAGIELSALQDQVDEISEADAEEAEEVIANEGMIRIPEGALDFNRHKEAFEKEFIIKALKMFKGRINQTALHANIPKKTLLRKIEKYGINAKDYIE
jgi:DNA-binding NtrC family response regulator